MSGNQARLSVIVLGLVGVTEANAKYTYSDTAYYVNSVTHTVLID